MLEILGQAALRTLLLAAIVRLGLWLLRIRRPQLRLMAWTVVLMAALAMPALQWATPLRLPVLPNFSNAALIRAANPQRHASVSQAYRAAPADEATTPTTITPWLEALYLLVSAILLLRLTVGIALSLRLVCRAAQVRLDWAADTHVRISRDVAAPVTVANVVLLPADVVDWPLAMREAVMAHERAHIARWDFATLLASQVNQAVFWFSPLSWWLHRRLAALAELASDDQAMEVTGDRPGYAEVLLEMGRRSGPLLRGLAMARPATLIHRIERILSDRVKTNPVSPIQQVILAVGAASLSIVAASSRPNSAPPLELARSAEHGQLPTLRNSTLRLRRQRGKTYPNQCRLPRQRRRHTPRPLGHQHSQSRARRLGTRSLRRRRAPCCSGSGPYMTRAPMMSRSKLGRSSPRALRRAATMGVALRTALAAQPAPIVRHPPPNKRAGRPPAKRLCSSGLMSRPAQVFTSRGREAPARTVRSTSFRQSTFRKRTARHG